MKPHIRYLSALLLAVAAAAPAGAQSAGSHVAWSADEQAVLKVVQTTFDAMRTRDTTLLRSAMDSAARIVMTFTRDGKPQVRMVPIDQFITLVAESKEELDETIYDPEVRISDNLATVWTRYEFRRGGQFSHCGVDAIQLARTEAGWKIVHITDTQRREGCPTRE